jgi:hypothetical protein
MKKSASLLAGITTAHDTVGFSHQLLSKNSIHGANTQLNLSNWQDELTA